MTKEKEMKEKSGKCCRSCCYRKPREGMDEKTDVQTKYCCWGLFFFLWQWIGAKLGLGVTREIGIAAKYRKAKRKAAILNKEAVDAKFWNDEALTWYEDIEKWTYEEENDRLHGDICHDHNLMDVYMHMDVKS